MTGLTKLFMYPNHVVNKKAATPGRHDKLSLLHSASMMLHVKKGTQQIRKTPENKIKKIIKS